MKHGAPELSLDTCEKPYAEMVIKTIVPWIHLGKAYACYFNLTFQEAAWNVGLSKANCTVTTDFNTARTSQFQLKTQFPSSFYFYNWNYNVNEAI